ncbi:hypothetical protein CVM52_17140 [Pseudooceanicola lipolyticus]|uniref:Acetolactate synthase n=1 Tax=Pseudooceanicola lipolyticus TaxID=2029104 RepID=A0A2M8IY27_9RHOB|nr:hypothetical protein CVM52_17140 [Pseudooceanicola lipolyticus]
MIRPTGIKLARAFGDAPAAPAGGARPTGWGRGCGFSGVLAVCATSLSADNAADTVAVPSGQPLDLIEVLADETPGEMWARFRFLAPDVARDLGRIDVEIAHQDMEHLCHGFAMDYLARHQIDAARIVISLSDRAVPFGEPDPQATQFFEIYRPEDGHCIWEPY